MNASKLGWLPACQAQLLVNSNKIDVSHNIFSFSNSAIFPDWQYSFFSLCRTFEQSQLHRSVNQHLAVMSHCGKQREHFHLECSESSPLHSLLQCRLLNIFLPLRLLFIHIGDLKLSLPITSGRAFSVQYYQKLLMGFFFCSRPLHLLGSVWWPIMTKVSQNKFGNYGVLRASKL